MILLRIAFLSTLIGSSAVASYHPKNRFPKAGEVSEKSFSEWYNMFFYTDSQSRLEFWRPEREIDTVFKAALLAIESEKLKEAKAHNALLAQLLDRIVQNQSQVATSAASNLNVAAPASSATAVDAAVVKPTPPDHKSSK